LFPTGYSRKRVRPSYWSLLLSLAICGIALYYTFYLFEGYSFIPLLIVLAITVGITWYRYRGLRLQLPRPYGSAKAVLLGPHGATRQALLFILTVILLVALLVMSLYLLPPLIFFSLIFGLTAGLPLTEIVFFGLLVRLEMASNSQIFLVREESEEKGKEILTKTVILVPNEPSL
jgi:hypothetical protein